MSEPDDEKPETPDEKPKPRRRRRTVDSATVPARIERRAEKVERTIKELIGWARGRSDDDRELGFLDQLSKDAKQVGYALARVGDRFKPLGGAMDTLLGDGGPLMLLVTLSASLRAGYRSAQKRAAERKQRREQEQAEAEQREQETPAGMVWVQMEGAEPMLVDEQMAILQYGYQPAS